MLTRYCGLLRHLPLDIVSLGIHAVLGVYCTPESATIKDKICAKYPEISPILQHLARLWSTAVHGEASHRRPLSPHLSASLSLSYLSVLCYCYIHPRSCIFLSISVYIGTISCGCSASSPPHPFARPRSCAYAHTYPLHLVLLDLGCVLSLNHEIL